METWMIVVTVALVVLPFVLMVAFNGRDRADSRGHRIDRAWRGRRQEI